MAETVCQICGQKFDRLTLNHIRRKHGMPTWESYYTAAKKNPVDNEAGYLREALACLVSGRPVEEKLLQQLQDSSAAVKSAVAGIQASMFARQVDRAMRMRSELAKVEAVAFDSEKYSAYKLPELMALMDYMAKEANTIHAQTAKQLEDDKSSVGFGAAAGAVFQQVNFINQQAQLPPELSILNALDPRIRTSRAEKVDQLLGRAGVVNATSFTK